MSRECSCCLFHQLVMAYGGNSHHILTYSNNKTITIYPSNTAHRTIITPRGNHLHHTDWNILLSQKDIFGRLLGGGMTLILTSIGQKLQDCRIPRFLAVHHTYWKRKMYTQSSADRDMWKLMNTSPWKKYPNQQGHHSFGL